jgi:hypothetical protein
MPHHKKTILLQKVVKSLGPGWILWINNQSVRSLYRSGHLMTVSRELSRYRLDLVGVQKVRWEGSGTTPAAEYTFFYRKGNENYELGTGFCT